ncbi:PTS lactose/cellobiose transporter subunit IIA [Mitsuokella multacida]|uniref:PTS lactose/cellobiose transporter subunit IIA n=1 Tax=Mitsuokella multacida TaxID=52226 RepID=UPI0026666654|nr:PTS lactose/cellobiose transporter subunit IIA [Mitsuokella multacida]MDD6381882.1 PTS lactose/cellobiose transporter subunit IIA [Selenomonadaceae bacterium]
MSKTEDTAFAIISAAGDGRAKIAQAMKQARRGNFGEAEDCLKEADEYLLKAHKIQTEELLQKEANDELKGPFNVLVAHAQDYVMTGMAMKEMAVEIVNLYTQLRAK